MSHTKPDRFWKLVRFLEVIFMKMEFAIKEKMMDNIISHFEALLAKGQDNTMLRYGLGNAYLKEKTFAIAAKHFAKALEFEPNYSAAWKGYGKALAENQETQNAIGAYTQGIAVAEKMGDKQAAKEMRVFLKRLQK